MSEQSNKFVPQIKLGGLASNLSTAVCNVTVSGSLLSAPVNRTISLAENSLLTELGLNQIITAQSSALLEAAINKSLYNMMQPTVTDFQNVIIDFTLAQNILVAEDSSIQIDLDLLPRIDMLSGL